MRNRGRFDLVSSGVLACYLFGALLVVIANRHGNPTLVMLFVLCAATVAAAWRSEAVTLALGAAALAGVLVRRALVSLGLFRADLFFPAAPIPPFRRSPDWKACARICCSARVSH
jgi:hypothetical protein